MESLSIDKREYLTIKQTAQLTNIGEHAIRNLCKISGNKFVLKVGTKTLINRIEFLNELKRRREL